MEPYDAAERAYRDAYDQAVKSHPEYKRDQRRRGRKADVPDSLLPDSVKKAARIAADKAMIAAMQADPGRYSVESVAQEKARIEARRPTGGVAADPWPSVSEMADIKNLDAGTTKTDVTAPDDTTKTDVTAPNDTTKTVVAGADDTTRTDIGPVVDPPTHDDIGPVIEPPTPDDIGPVVEPPTRTDAAESTAAEARGPAAYRRHLEERLASVQDDRKAAAAEQRAAKARGDEAAANLALDRYRTIGREIAKLERQLARLAARKP
jgi:hypothetical protein